MIDRDVERTYYKGDTHPNTMSMHWPLTSTFNPNRSARGRRTRQERMATFTENESMMGIYMILAILLGSAPAMYCLYKMLRDIDQSNFDEFVLENPVVSNKRKKQSRAEVCKICSAKGTPENPLSLGGCGTITCEKCYKTYKPLPQRCPFCQAYLCYRKYRTPLSSFGTMKNAEMKKDD